MVTSFCSAVVVGPTVTTASIEAGPDIYFTACNQPEDMAFGELAELPRPRAGYEALDCVANAAIRDRHYRHAMRFFVRKQTWR